MKTGVIVGRFQLDNIHDAHVKIIEHALERNDKVIVFIGTTVVRLGYRNPLPFESRKAMIHELFPDVLVLEIPNQKCNHRWSNNLDEIISANHSRPSIGDGVTMYGSRDSFLNTYHGVFKKEFVEGIIIEGLSATKRREFIHGNPEHNCPSWRRGVIWSSEHKYPTSYQTVDIAIINKDKVGGTQILLGKRLTENKFRFMGGFCDVEDSSLECSVIREAKEEAGNISIDNIKYLGSFRVDDWRYGTEKDKIMTTLFVCDYLGGTAEANDDINEVQWFETKELTEDVFEPEHIPLFYKLKEHLKNNKNETTN